MEKYGKSTRAEELNGFNNADEAWEWHLYERVKTAKNTILKLKLVQIIGLRI